MLLLVPPGAQAWVLSFIQSSEGPLNSTGAEGRMGGVSRPLRGQASRGRYRETLGRKERIGRVFGKKKRTRAWCPRVTYSPESLPRSGPATLSMPGTGCKALHGGG